MTDKFDLEKYLSVGAENVVKGLLTVSSFSLKESRFLTQYSRAAKKAERLRAEAESHGEHIPVFLIASITSVCNLHCAGCYARKLGSCADCEPVEQLSADEWGNVFEQARGLGIGFVLLVGGEPLVRTDVLERAAGFPEIIFPIFTNGTMLEQNIELFDDNRNLVPILSIEGGQEVTDARRGKGVYEQVNGIMRLLKDRRILFGASVTVTKENLDEVISDEFISGLKADGCKLLLYVEFVPTDESMSYLAPDEQTREKLSARIDGLRESDSDMLYISFPGDEKESGGCLAAGRGFFHINSQGGAEPCPFSPYSDINVREHTLKEVMQSALFRNLREQGIMSGEHDGGCVLYTRRQEVEALLNGK
ncbi:MAG: radical SAM protein [Eubacterium sp.]|nr:radical SAM protein [Eubacterium sp.]